MENLKILKLILKHSLRQGLCRRRQERRGCLVRRGRRVLLPRHGQQRGDGHRPTARAAGQRGVVVAQLRQSHGRRSGIRCQARRPGEDRAALPL